MNKNKVKQLMSQSIKIIKIKIKLSNNSITMQKINNFIMIAVNKIMIEFKKKKKSGKSSGNIKNKKIKKYNYKNH